MSRQRPCAEQPRGEVRVARRAVGPQSRWAGSMATSVPTQQRMEHEQHPVLSRPAIAHPGSQLWGAAFDLHMQSSVGANGHPGWEMRVLPQCPLTEPRGRRLEGPQLAFRRRKLAPLGFLQRSSTNSLPRTGSPLPGAENTPGGGGWVPGQAGRLVRKRCPGAGER